MDIWGFACVEVDKDVEMSVENVFRNFAKFKNWIFLELRCFSVEASGFFASHETNQFLADHHSILH